jgi:cysteine protease ATG4
MSEPDDLDLDEEEDEVDDDGNEGEGDDEPFFDTQSVRSSQGRGASDKGNKSEDVDTEDDPVGPITPGPGAKFEFVDRPDAGNAKPRREVDGDEESDDGGRGRFEEDDDIEDDWADPLALDSSPVPGRDKKDAPLSKGRLATTSASAAKSSSSSKLKAKSKKEQPVPVPGVVIQEHYPFPVSPADEGVSSSSPEPGRSRQVSATRVTRQQAGYRMHTARARDGGRTQSGGVKGVLFSEPS